MPAGSFRMQWNDGIVEVSDLECIQVEVVSAETQPTLEWKNSVVNRHNVPKEAIKAAFQKATAP
eukprot:5217705-Karenia_brevis.AAC.1